MEEKPLLTEVTVEALEENGADLATLETLLVNLHKATDQVFRYAWSKGYHVELAAFAMNLRDKVEGQ